MQKGSVLGYDLNEKNCQISYYDEIKRTGNDGSSS